MFYVVFFVVVYRIGVAIFRNYCWGGCDFPYMDVFAFMEIRKTKNMPNYIALLIPVFLLLIAIEWWFSVKRNDEMYEGSNTVMNMAIGAVDQFGALLYLFGLFV